MNNLLMLFLLLVSNSFVTFSLTSKQPLANIAIHKVVIDIQESACITAYPIIMDYKHDDIVWVNVVVELAEPSEADWVAVFSPANFNASDCYSESDGDVRKAPYICTAPLKISLLYFLLAGCIVNPKAPLYPRLAQGKSWDQMAVTWTSGYNIDEATPFVEYGWIGQGRNLSPAETLTFSRSSMCGPPASTVGWRDPGFIHTSFLDNMWPNTMYDYRVGHRLVNGSIVWGKSYSFKSSPSPGQDSLQRVIIFGDMGKGERDGSNEYSDFQPGSLITTNRLENDLENFDIVFHIGNLAFAEGYISQWDQFTAQIQPVASRKAYMTASKDPFDGSFDETGRGDLQKLWQKYKVDIAFYGHAHNYERTCPLYENKCVDMERHNYSSSVMGTIHVVVGGAGSELSSFPGLNPNWILYQDEVFGFGKLTAFNHSSLLFEYMKSSNGCVYDSFTISRDYKVVKPSL
ncbi:hypothetical protein L1987_44986 [Smallanthus sonchifolius]|uniref:Uncharacterized protein n=1 Tax=Smallanthus sonchifolius TaxID=185202 RepID=A0ACB9GS02_9ASTR|nr:hypothetical protein L1987_44986 [Smallanthus sonchifolius]